MTNCLPILTITILTVLGTAAAVSIIVGMGKAIIDATNHYGGHHEN